MALEFCVLASGSKGNCSLICSEKARVILDVGLNMKNLTERMHAVGHDPDEVDAVVVTHAHSDHVAGAAAFAKKFNVPVYAPFSVAAGMERARPVSGLRSFDGGDFFIKDMTVSPFSLPHDVPCYGYSFYCAGSKLSFLTDLGEMKERTLDDVADSDVVVIEANHDVSLLKANVRYSASLKARILSTHGHLSNDACAAAAKKLATRGVKQIVLAHLSEQNNDPLIALGVVRDALKAEGFVVGRDVLLEVAYQTAATKFFRIE